MANIQKISLSEIVSSVPEAEIRTGAKYFGCVDKIRNI